MEFSSHNNHQPFLPEQKDPLFFDGVPPETQIVFWLSFNLFVTFLLLLDLFYFMRTKTVTNMKTAIKFTILWIVLALIFNAAIYHYKGRKMAMVWLTSYLLEKFLSVDNLFVIVTIFSSFRTPANFQQKVLTWGIFGAIIFRAIFIVTGVLIIKQFHFLLTIFALFLVYTGFKLLFRGKEEDEEKEEAGFQEVVDSSLPSEKSSQTDLEDGGKNGKVFLSKKSSPHLEKNLIIRVMKRFIPITNEYDEKGRFFVQCSEDLQTINESDISAASSSSSSPSLPLYSSSSSSSYSSSPKFGRGGSTPKYKYAATPLLILLIVIETTDLIFALDSIPAILSITTDSFIVYTSNIFAILGLRALYFCLAALIKLFTYLEYALAVILIFIGAKMLLVFFGIHIPTEAALLFVILCLAVSIGFSLVFVKKAPVVRRHRIRSFIV